MTLIRLNLVLALVLSGIGSARLADLANSDQALAITEHDVHSQLFDHGRYKNVVRPLIDHSKSIIVELGLQIFTVDDIVEQDQTMKITACLKTKWNDEFMRWDPQKNGNLSWFATPSSDVWLPDIAMVNSPDPYKLTRKKAFVSISADGNVGYFPSGSFTTRCHISLQYFPLDYQACDIILESWVYPYHLLSLVPAEQHPIDMSGYYHNQQWHLSNFRVITGNVTYDGLDFSVVKFRFYFRRKILYYGILAIFPCTLMSALQVFSHTLAVEHPARVGLLTALFLSSIMLLGSLASQMPKSSEGATLIQMYMMLFCHSLVASMLITFMNMYAWFRVPSWPEPSFSRLLRAFLIDIGKQQGKPVDPSLPSIPFAERKERWLQFTMLIDKIAFYFLGAVNVISPLIIFGVLPLFQNYLDHHDFQFHSDFEQ